MKVYLASMFSTLPEIRKKADELKTIGIECTSSWLNESSDPKISMKDASLTPSFLLSTAIADVEDILKSDALVLFTVDPDRATVRGGRHFELGFAYAAGVTSFICGPKENIFHYLPNIQQFSTFEETKQELLKLKFKKYPPSVRKSGMSISDPGRLQ